SPTGPLSILFDAYWTVDGPPSGRNVVLSLVHAWRNAFPRDILTLATPSAQDSARALTDVADLSLLELPPGLLRLHRWWISRQLASATSGFDAVITQNFTPSIRRGEETRTTVATFVHDAIFVD